MPYYLSKSWSSNFDLCLPEGMNLQMVNTEDRLDGYEAFFKSHARDKVILDVGAGLGLIGMKALAYGASHVYFVEQDGVSAAALKAITQSHPMASRMTVIQGDFHELQASSFQYAPDYLVCELWGPHLWNEGLPPTHAQAKQLFPKIDAIPSTYRSFFNIVEIPKSEMQIWPREQIPGVNLASIYAQQFMGKLITSRGIAHRDLVPPQECFSLEGARFCGEWETIIDADYKEVFFHLSHYIHWPSSEGAELWRDTYCYIPEIKAGQRVRVFLNEIYVPQFEVYG